MRGWILLALLTGCAARPVAEQPESVPVSVCAQAIGKLKDAGNDLARALDKDREDRDEANQSAWECRVWRTT